MCGVDTRWTIKLGDTVPQAYNVDPCLLLLLLCRAVAASGNAAAAAAGGEVCLDKCISPVVKGLTWDCNSQETTETAVILKHLGAVALPVS